MSRAIVSALALTVLAASLVGQAQTLRLSPATTATTSWPNEPSGMTLVNDQPWDSLTANGWSYLRRSATKDAVIATDTTAPFSPTHALQIIYTPGCCIDAEPGVSWISLPGVREIFTGFFVKLSANWIPNPAGGGKIGFLFTDVGGQVYTNYYHPSDTVQGPPYRIGINTEWAPYGQQIWYPNVATTPINNNEWHRVEVYYKWETTPQVSNDGILRWWVDGALNGNQTAVHYPAARFIEYQFAPTVQFAGPNERSMFIDHSYVSVR